MYPSVLDDSVCVRAYSALTGAAAHGIITVVSGVAGLLPFGLARVSGASMVPAYYDGDRLLVHYGAEVGPGDAVLARDPRDRQLILLKRIARRESGGWWLLADNPYAPGDSRQFGAVPDALVLGRVVARLWPPRLVRARIRALTRGTANRLRPTRRK